MKMPANLRSLIGKLNDTARKAMEGAAGLCLARTHYDIEVEHFLLKALDAADGDLSLILRISRSTNRASRASSPAVWTSLSRAMPEHPRSARRS